MFLFETILFYNGAPCFYKIHATNTSGFYCEAQPNFYYRNIPFPNFTVTEINDEWQATGTNDDELVQQVVKELQSHLQYS